METIRLSEELTVDYTTLAPVVIPIIHTPTEWHQERRCQVAGILVCTLGCIAIFIAITVELINGL